MTKNNLPHDCQFCSKTHEPKHFSTKTKEESFCETDSKIRKRICSLLENLLF